MTSPGAWAAQITDSTLQSLAVPGPCPAALEWMCLNSVSVWSEDAASDPEVLQLTHLSFLPVGRADADLFLHP